MDGSNLDDMSFLLKIISDKTSINNACLFKEW